MQSMKNYKFLDNYNETYIACVHCYLNCAFVKTKRANNPFLRHRAARRERYLAF
jgi:hypothetical protein